MQASRLETFRRIGLWRETMAVTTGHGRSWQVMTGHDRSWRAMAGIIILSIDGMGSGPPEMRLLSAPGRPFAQVRQVTSRACEDGRIIGTASPIRATPVLGPPSPPHRLKQPTVKSSILRSCRVTIHWPRKVISQHQSKHNSMGRGPRRLEGSRDAPLGRDHWRDHALTWGHDFA